MKKSHLVWKGSVHALGVFGYVLLVVSVLSYAKVLFGEQEDKFLIPIFMLLLFVVSATITGLLVLGKPIYLYMNGLKREAITLLFATLAWLVLFLIAVAAAMATF